MSDEELLKAFTEIGAGLGWPPADLEHIDVLTRVRDLVALAEEQMAERGLGDAYSRVLCEVVGVEIVEHEGWYDPSVDADGDLIRLITAPPEARVKAMLAVLSAHSPISAD
jgi:hypothetical protein